MFKHRSRPLIIFYFLVVYVVLQFSWWTYMIVQITHEYYNQRIENSLLWGDPATTMLYEQELDRKIWMIVGEAVVFVAILAIGIVKMRSSVRAEDTVAKQHRNFLLSVTHELKSPIASLKLQLQTVTRLNKDEEKRAELLNRALVDTERLNALVENILVAARLENQSIRLERQNENLSEFLTDLLKELQTGVIHGRTINAQVQPEVWFQFDRIAFTSIITNLLENATKYSDPGEVIDIKLTEEGDKIVLTVADQGIGVPVADRTEIFKRFYRVEEEAVRKSKGTGLGLFIVKELVELHKGMISVSSNSPKGSIFEAQFRKI